MTVFSHVDAQAELGRRMFPFAKATRRDAGARRRALADFAEEVRILFRYATGRDYYDRRLSAPED